MRSCSASVHSTSWGTARGRPGTYLDIGPELDGEDQSIVRTALLCDQHMVGVVQVEISGKIMGVGGPA